MSAPRRLAAVAADSTVPVANTSASEPSARAWYHDPYRTALLLIVVFSISKLPGYFGILRALRPALLLVMFCAAYAFLNPKKIGSALMFRWWPARMILLMFVLSCCSAVFGISLGRAASFILRDYVKTMVMTFLLLTAVRGSLDLRRFIWAIAFGGIALAWLSIFIVGISKTASAVTYDANDVGVIMVTTLPLAFLLLHASRGRGRLVALIGIGLVAATIAKSQSRGAFVGLCVVGIGLLFVVPGVSMVKRFLVLGAALLALSLSAPEGNWDSMRSIVEDPKADYNWDALNGRRNIAKRGIGYMMKYPLFGVGINNFPMAEGQISDKAKYLAAGQVIRWAAAHNSYVQVGAETGVTGLVVWVSLIVAAITALLGWRARLPRQWLHGTPEQRLVYLSTAYVPIAYAGFAVSAFFVSFAWNEPLYILSALTCGIFTAIGVERAQAHGALAHATPATMPGGGPALAAAAMRRPGWRTAASTRWLRG